MKKLKELLDKIDMVLVNKIPYIDIDLIYNIEIGKLEDEDEIFQYFITNDKSYLERLFSSYELENFLVVMYSNILETFVVGMKFLDNRANIKIKEKMF